MATIDITDLPSPSASKAENIDDLPSPKKKSLPAAQEKFRLRMPEETPEQKAAFDRNKAFLKSAVEAIPGAAGAYGGMETGAALGTALYPGVGTVLGGLGGALAGGYLGEKVGKKTEQAIPESIKSPVGLGTEQREQEKKTYPLTSTLGTIAPDVLAVAPGIKKAGTYVAGLVKNPPPIADIKDLSEIGKKGFDFLKEKAGKLFESRSAEATQKYNAAFDAARKAQAQGQPFGSSRQGQTLLSELENDKRVLAGGETFEKGQEKIAGIDRLINAIKGKTTGGFERTAKETPTGKKIYRITGTPEKTIEKDIEALVEELRFLRDVDAKGKPYDAYAALSADYKRDLIKKMEAKLYDWAPEYRAADEAYKAASAKLKPFQTDLMSGALKGEKFDPADLVISPEKFGQKFFSDVNGVKNLKEATNDFGQVARLGKEYTASILANKSPQQIQAFVKDTANTGWLKEAGIYDDVVNYANKATSSESKQKILSQLTKGALIGIGATAIGGPAFYGTRRALGI